MEEFNSLLQRFAHATLAIYKADYLMKNERKLRITENEIYEIAREKRVSEWTAREMFEQILIVGIPLEEISMHLQIDVEDEGDEGEDEENV